jgi:choline dehydrogenase
MAVPPSWTCESATECGNPYSVPIFPYMDRPNLTVLCHALVARLIMSGKQAGGVEIIHDGKVQCIAAGVEVLLSLGAIHTPKVLML